MNALMKELIKNVELKNEIIESGYHFDFSYSMYRGIRNIVMWLHSDFVDNAGKVEFHGTVGSENEGLNKCLDIIIGIQAFGGYK